MIVDKIDGCLVLQEFDLVSTLSEFKYNRTTPEYIERSILKYIYLKNHITFNAEYGFEELLFGISDEVLSKIISDVKTMFFSSERINYNSFHDAYLFYYLEANIFKVWKPLLDLHINNLLKKDLIILDIGAGPGSVPLGIVEFYKLLAVKNPGLQFSIIIDIIEAEETFIDIANHMISETARFNTSNLGVKLRNKVHQVLDEKFEYNSMDTYDLITMSNFMTINERDNIKRGTAILSQLPRILKEDGSIIIIEPGDSVNGQLMKTIRNEITDSGDLNVYSPCSGVWEKKESYKCNCYSPTRTYWNVPRLHKFLFKKGIRKAGREQLPFQYVVYRRDGLTKYNEVVNQQYYVKLKDLRQCFGKSINVKANVRSVIERKNSHQLAILLCDGSCTFDKQESEIKAVMNKDFLTAVGITCHVIAGERLTLKNVIVKSTKYGVELEVSNDSKIDIEY
ncbi:SAM-dependent methyltransferase [Sedimentibacter acidaminivorans]|uniref:SAM-dependent methyltransferase n=1 Tax=Sedimentibacter acidaminivorans TaxID=913099 RepID=A0ABS4GC44_9FIRM|nr:class I SAM-dependent methyltransferase [Sedimentibacter acidaminivorans]MBP1925259.1 SAM-dependent methyltransferase [Sedimentibacter acidaminivorans]